MAYFVMEKMPDMGKTGKQVLYPKLKGVEPMDVEAMVERIARTTTFGVGEVKGVLHELVGEMAHALAQGRSVKLEGLGTFTPTLALRKGKGQEEAERSGTRLNRASVEVGNVRFRVDKGLLGHINTVCNLHRAPGKRVYSSRRYTPEQRLELARQYLDTHPTMCVTTYRLLTGLLRTAATEELRRWASQPESGIGTTGRGSHKLYIRREVTPTPPAARQSE